MKTLKIKKKRGARKAPMKAIFKYVDSSDAQEHLNRAFNILFEIVLRRIREHKSQ